MKINKRIFISNTVMVSISLVLLLSIVGVLLYSFKDEYLNEEIPRYEIDKNINFAKEIIKNGVNDTVQWENIAKKLEKIDYQMSVEKMGLEQFNNLRPHQIEELGELPKLNLSINDKYIFFQENQTILITNAEIEGSIYNIVIAHSGDRIEIEAMNRKKFDLFLLLFISVGVFSILILLVITQLFTKNLVKHIMRPVLLLSESASRIRTGDLSKEIQYYGDDEFENLCISFNDMQKSLKNEKEKIASYERARIDMITGISHDLRTPLTSVKGFLKGIQDGIANTEEKQKTYLNIAYKKACDMDNLLKKLFEFSKLQSGNLSLNLEKIEFGVFMENLIFEFKEDFMSSNIEVILKKEKKEYFVYIDKEQIKRVISNLIENSIKYGNKTPLMLRINLDKKDNLMEFSFADNGIGVPTEMLERIFEQFFRTDESRSNKDGNGLGLYIVKHIIEEHQGFVQAFNDNGLKIVMTLPLREED